MDADAHRKLVLARPVKVVRRDPAMELGHRAARRLDLGKAQEGAIARGIDDAAAPIQKDAVQVVNVPLL